MGAAAAAWRSAQPLRGRILPELFADAAEYSCNLLGLSHFQKRQMRNALMGIVYQNPHLGLRMQVSRAEYR